MKSFVSRAISFFRPKEPTIPKNTFNLSLISNYVFYITDSINHNMIDNHIYEVYSVAIISKDSSISGYEIIFWEVREDSTLFSVAKFQVSGSFATVSFGSSVIAEFNDMDSLESFLNALKDSEALRKRVNNHIVLMEHDK